MLVIFGVFSWLPIVRGRRHELPEDQPRRDPDVGRPGQLRAGPRPTRCSADGDPQHRLLRAARARLRLPGPARRGRAHERGPARARACYSRPRLPARWSCRPSSRCCCGSSSTTRGPTGVFNTILGWVGHRPARRGSRPRRRPCRRSSLEATWAAAGGTVIIYLAALLSVPRRAVRRGRGRRRRHLAQDLARHACRSCAASCSSR